ncbi:MAG: hypothetical protein ACLQU3_32555 [Limisphaerales bacterium]
MRNQYAVVETSLNRAEFRWKWLKFLQHSFLLGCTVCALLLLLAGAIIVGWVTSKSLATTFFALLAIVAFIAWAIIIISVLASSPDRAWLAAALERVNPRLLDRLNTLLYLERRPRDARLSSFALRIARQAFGVLAAKKVRSPFQSTRARAYMLNFGVALTATVLVYQFYSPWSRLLAAEKAKAKPPVVAEKPLELTLPTTNNAEQSQTWGEVRITDPGSDLRVTKVDVVPLQIEAAANQALKKVGWFSTINGAGETPHELPPPSEPRYAVYQPTVYLDELRLSDWDVMTYYAKANTEKENSFASDVYFLEVRPFREDILKMPGGEGGEAYQCLSELSMLISRQQHVIRQTHQHLQKPQEQETLQAQDRKKLSEAEADLGESARHLYAEMAGRMENKPIGDALDNLAKAEKSLDRASQLLGDNVMNEAQNRERRALAELIAARKMFQKAVSDNPDAFGGGGGGGGDGDNGGDDSPTADAMRKLNAKKLSEMAEFRNEAKAAQQFVDKTLEQQRNLEQQARTAPPTDYSRLGDQEKQLQQSLSDFEQLHPRPFKGTQAEAQQTQEAMAKASDSLQRKNTEARAATQQATQQLEKLDEAMKSQTAGQQLADAYKLKQMLDKEIQTFGQCANPGAGGQVSDAAVDRTTSEARETVNQLKKVAEQEPTRDMFGPPLRAALSGANKTDLDSKLARVQLAQDQSTRQQRAGEAKDALSKVSKAFEDSEPKAMQMAQKTDSLKPGQDESFNQGMAELESLLKQLEDKRQVSPENQGKQGKEALGNLQSGMRGRYGDNESGTQLLQMLDRMLKADKAIDVEDLRKLISELEHFSVETSDQMARREDKPEVTNIDPSRLPPAYRGRIQKYFERLSEK